MNSSIRTINLSIVAVSLRGNGNKGIRGIPMSVILREIISFAAPINDPVPYIVSIT